MLELGLYSTVFPATMHIQMSYMNIKMNDISSRGFNSLNIMYPENILKAVQISKSS